jgi:3-methyladenine DNA glycosylase AlkC
MTMQDKIYVKVMEFIMEYEEDYIKELAKTTTDPEILNELSKDASYWVRRNVANNLNTTPETLDYLSRDEDSYVRSAVAEHLNTSPEILDYLSKDEYWWIRYRVAKNFNTTPETLDYLSKDKDWATRYKAKSNPNYPNIFKRIKMIFNKTKNTTENNDNWIQDFENSIINSLTEKAKLVYEIHK